MLLQYRINVFHVRGIAKAIKFKLLKHLIIIMLLFGAVHLSAQTSILYEYDEAGNRVLCKPLTVIPLTQSPLSSISVYPNPNIRIVYL